MDEPLQGILGFVVGRGVVPLAFAFGVLLPLMDGRDDLAAPRHVDGDGGPTRGVGIGFVESNQVPLKSKGAVVITFDRELPRFHFGKFFGRTFDPLRPVHPKQGVVPSNVGG